MRVRVAGLYRHPKSKMWWFRMVVPERYRASVGKREWKVSLDTPNEVTARLRHAEKLAEVRRYMAQLDAQSAVSVGDRADDIVERGMDALARANVDHQREGGYEFDLARGHDNVTYGMLKMLAFRTRVGWGGDHASDAHLRPFTALDPGAVVEFAELEPDQLPTLGSGFQTLEQRKAASAHIDLYEAQPKYQGAAFREIARGLLAARDWRAASFEAQLVANAAGLALPARGALFEAVAERVLRRLADHWFGHWPASINLVLSPMMTAMGAHLMEQHAPAERQHGGDRTLADALALWRERRGLAEGELDKSASEWALSADRFRELIGTDIVAGITAEQVKRFRDLSLKLPSRPKKEVGSLALAEQIAAAKASKLPTLSPPSVGKNVAAIKSLLALAREEGWVVTNVAEGVTVEGAKHLGTERDHFSDAEMRAIYGSRLMTDPDACSDTMFWILFLAPFHGSRPGEHCKLKPIEVVEEDGDWVMRFRADRRRRTPAEAVDDHRPRRLKTKGSQRDVPLHWIVLEGGFLEFVAAQRDRGAAWVFDELVPDRFGDRYKYLSRQINAALRKIGITDPDKAFYSTRHSMKREGRRRRIAEQHLDQLTGHASGSTGRKYGQGVPTDVLKADIDRLEFRSVDWDPVVACALTRVKRLPGKALVA